MRHILLAVAASAVLLAPASAGAQSSARLNVRLDIPVSCNAKLIEARPSGQTVQVAVRRTCNAPHALTLTGARANMAGASVTDLGSRTRRPADEAVFRHHVPYTNTVDRFVIEDVADSIAAASDLQVTIAAL